MVAVTEDDYIDIALSRLTRLVMRQHHTSHIVMNERQIKSILLDLIRSSEELRIKYAGGNGPLTNEKVVV
jgi:hypothetical protein